MEGQRADEPAAPSGTHTLTNLQHVHFIALFSFTNARGEYGSMVERASCELAALD